MKIQIQKWSEYDRVLFIADGGSVQVEIHPEPINGFGYRVWLYSLWVEPQMRCNKIAAQLMDAAESYVSNLGIKEMALEWVDYSTPEWVLHWYLRRGYEIRYRKINNVLLIKPLDKE